MNRYSHCTEAQLRYIISDAGAAAEAMRSIDAYQSECKYRDQVNDAVSELYARQRAAATTPTLRDRMIARILTSSTSAQLEAIDDAPDLRALDDEMLLDAYEFFVGGYLHNAR